MELLLTLWQQANLEKLFKVVIQRVLALHCGPIFFTAILYLCCQSIYHYTAYYLSYNHHLALSSTAQCIVTYSVQFSSVAQSCPTLCDPTNRSTPGLPVHHHDHYNHQFSFKDFLLYNSHKSAF